METLTQSEIFFFISSVSFVVLWVLVSIFLFYLIRTTKTLSRIIDKAEDDINKMGDVTKEMLEDIRYSTAWGFIFGRKKNKKKD